jgi:Cys-tRNA(Pro)/Cys-tRNA(Cys) deacylase
VTPAIKAVEKAKIPYQVHEYHHDTHASSYGIEAVEKLAVTPTQVFKTLVVKLDKTMLAVAVIPVLEKLSMKAVATACGAKKAEMAEPLEVQKSTGYVLGGVSPIGQKKALLTIIEQSAGKLTTIYVSGGRRGLEIQLNPLDLQSLTRASFAPICQSNIPLRPS